MFFHKLLLTTTIIAIGVFYGAHIDANQKEIQVKYCKNADCSEFSDRLTLNQLADLKQIELKEDPMSFYNMLGFYISAAVPIVALLWWIINLQQDKKNLEQNVKQECAWDKKLEKILTKQELIINDFSGEIEKLHFKFEQILQQLTSYQLEAVKTAYAQNGKIEMLVDNLATTKALIVKVEEIENFLVSNYQFKIGHSEKD